MFDTTIYNNVPEEIRNTPNWLVWKYEIVNDRQTKVPYQICGWKAKSNDPSTWTTFDEAVAAAEGWDGIGWCVPLSDEGPFYWGIDVDDAIDPETGELNVWENSPVQPQDILDTASYSYVTPSGAGFRVMIKADVPVIGRKQISFGPRNPKTGKVPGIEMYSSGRFFTFTPEQIPGTPDTVENRTEQIEAIRAKLFPVMQPKAKAQTPRAASTSNERRETSMEANFIDRVVDEVLEGRIPGTSRNNLTIGIMGVLVSAGWPREGVQEVAQLLVAAFNEEDPGYDMEATTAKQLRVLDSYYSRLANHELIPGFKFLAETLDQQAIDALKTIKPPPNANTECASDAKIANILNMLATSRLSTMNIAPAEYLYEPFLLKGAITAFTGKPQHGKSTFTNDMLHKLANANDEVMVIYCDADNPGSIARDRSERLRGTLEDRISYWAGFSIDAEGKSQPPWRIDDPLWPGLIRAIHATGKHVVIVFDTWNSFMDGRDENSNSETGVLGNCLREMTHAGSTVVVIHHKGRGPLAGPSRGASAFDGMVDAGWLVDSEIVNNEIKTMNLTAWKSRMGKTKPYSFKMVEGRPVADNESNSYDANIFSFICKHVGKTKEQIENEAHRSASGFTRKMIRDAVTKFLLAGKLTTVSYKIHLKDAVIAEPEKKQADLFD